MQLAHEAPTVARAVRRLHTPTFARVAAMGSNDQCEQFNYGDSDHEHRECYRIVIEPMPPLYVHDTPACHSTTVALNAKARTSNSIAAASVTVASASPFPPRADYLTRSHASGSRHLAGKANQLALRTVTFPPRYRSALEPSGELTPTWLARIGEAAMTGVLNDLLLFSCLAAFVTGVVIAAATILI